MRVRVVGIVSILLAVALVVAVVMLLGARSDIESMRNENAALVTDIQSLESDKSELISDISESTHRNATLESDVASLETSVMALETSVTSLKADIESEQQSKSELQSALSDSQSSNVELNSTVLSLENVIEQTLGQLSEVQDDNAGLEQRIETMQSKLDVLQKDVGDKNRLELDKANLQSDINALKSDIRNLNSEIAQLMGRRSALIPRTRSSRVLCTGSMEPAITCLDRITLLTNITFDEIVVGSVVSYREGDTYVLHRVIDIRPGMVLTQGDANDVDDGWVEFSSIRGYLIAIRKNAHPENAELRDRVNSAREAVDKAYETYKRLAERYCGGLDKVNPCNTSPSNFNKVLSAHEHWVTTWCVHDRALHDAQTQDDIIRLPYISFRCRG